MSRMWNREQQRLTGVTGCAAVSRLGCMVCVRPDDSNLSRPRPWMRMLDVELDKTRRTLLASSSSSSTRASEPTGGRYHVEVRDSSPIAVSHLRMVMPGIERPGMAENRKRMVENGREPIGACEDEALSWCAGQGPHHPLCHELELAGSLLRDVHVEGTAILIPLHIPLPAPLRLCSTCLSSSFLLFFHFLFRLSLERAPRTGPHPIVHPHRCMIIDAHMGSVRMDPSPSDHSASPGSDHMLFPPALAPKRTATEAGLKPWRFTLAGPLQGATLVRRARGE
nr:hypothetical protein CFP56_00975 [Quercus suber]